MDRSKGVRKKPRAGGATPDGGATGMNQSHDTILVQRTARECGHIGCVQMYVDPSTGRYRHVGINPCKTPWEMPEPPRRHAPSNDALDSQRRMLEQRQLDLENQRIDRQLSRWASQDAGTPEIASGEALDAFTHSFDFAELAVTPACLQRSDNETILYAGKHNSIFGGPGSGKTWLAILGVTETVMRGGHCLWIDAEDSPQTFKTRALKLGFDPLLYADKFKFVDPGFVDFPAAVAEVLAWFSETDEPCMVFVDAAESCGCPSDGRDVTPWYRQFVDPFVNAGVGVTTIDHVVKNRQDNPALGQIGSQHKLARVSGAALYVDGEPWTKKLDGYINLFVHKDRPSDLPARRPNCVAVAKGTYRDGAFMLELVPPDNEASPNLPIEILRVLADAGPDGVRGQDAIRAEVKGRKKDIGQQIKRLCDTGYIDNSEKDGRAYIYRITEEGLEILSIED